MALLHHLLKRESNEYGTVGNPNLNLSHEGNSTNVLNACK